MAQVVQGDSSIAAAAGELKLDRQYSIAEAFELSAAQISALPENELKRLGSLVDLYQRSEATVYDRRKLATLSGFIESGLAGKGNDAVDALLNLHRPADMFANEDLPKGRRDDGQTK